MAQELKYIGPYKVVKIFRISGRRQVLARNLTLERAKQIVKSFPDSTRHMVVFTKQFWADKYFVKL